MAHFFKKTIGTHSYSFLPSTYVEVETRYAVNTIGLSFSDQISHSQNENLEIGNCANQKLLQAARRRGGGKPLFETRIDFLFPNFCKPKRFFLLCRRLFERKVLIIKLQLVDLP